MVTYHALSEVNEAAMRHVPGKIHGQNSSLSFSRTSTSQPPLQLYSAFVVCLSVVALLPDTVREILAANFSSPSLDPPPDGLRFDELWDRAPKNATQKN